MAKEIMRRAAADNKYMHKDFHAALSTGIDYLNEHYGEEAVREYIREFALRYYSPLRKELVEKGLSVLRDHLQRIYEAEGGSIRATLSDDELIVETDFSPAVKHMRSRGHRVSDLFHETIRTLNDALCEGSPFAAELLHYEPETGGSVQRFYRRTQ